MLSLFKKSLVVFWFFWWLIALWTDVIGGLAHLGYLKASWAPDMNYPFLVNTLAMYPLPQWVAPFLFVAIIAWSTVNVVLFADASFSLNKSKAYWVPKAQKAFIVSLWLWLAFFLADQMVMKFAEEENHMVQGGFELLSFMALLLLP